MNADDHHAHNRYGRCEKGQCGRTALHEREHAGRAWYDSSKSSFGEVKRYNALFLQYTAQRGGKSTINTLQQHKNHHNSVFLVQTIETESLLAE